MGKVSIGRPALHDPQRRAALRTCGARYTQPRLAALADIIDALERPSGLPVEIEDARQGLPFAAAAFDLDARQHRGRSTRQIPQFAVALGRLVPVNPFKERKVSNVAAIADCHDSHRNEKRPGLVRLGRATHARIWTARASLAAA